MEIWEIGPGNQWLKKMERQIKEIMWNKKYSEKEYLSSRKSDLSLPLLLFLYFGMYGLWHQEKFNLEINFFYFLFILALYSACEICITVLDTHNNWQMEVVDIFFYYMSY